MGVDAVRVLEQTGVLEYHLKASCEKLKMFTTHPQAKTKITKQRVRAAKPTAGDKNAVIEIAKLLLKERQGIDGRNRKGPPRGNNVQSKGRDCRPRPGSKTQLWTIANRKPTVSLKKEAG